MPVTATRIPGLLVVDWPAHEDERGFFRQTCQVREVGEALGRTSPLLQTNHARSHPGVLRGFHAEPWDKSIYVAGGTALYAVADVRPDSPTFAAAEAFLLGDAPGRHRYLFVAEGLANAFLALGDRPVDCIYGFSSYWSPDAGRTAVAWDDPDLAVDWPVTQPLLSDADRSNPTLRQRFPDHPRWRA